MVGYNVRDIVSQNKSKPTEEIYLSTAFMINVRNELMIKTLYVFSSNKVYR